MQLLSLRHQTPPRKRIRILTAQQRSYLPASLGVDDLEPSTIAIGPDQFLVERWY